MVLLPSGNNIPVFFERDGAVFVEQNKCLKPNPVTGIQEGWRVLDFLSHHPESTHVVRSIPSCAAVLSGADGLPLSYHLLLAACSSTTNLHHACCISVSTADASIATAVWQDLV